MADTIETVNVEGPSPTPRRLQYGGVPPWLQAAVVGGGVGAVAGGPLGLLLGAGAGIVGNLRKKNYLDAQSAFVENTKAEADTLRGEIDAALKTASPDDALLLNHLKGVSQNAMYRLMTGNPDEMRIGKQMYDQANAAIVGMINQNKTEHLQQNAFQRGLVGNAAEGYRQEFQTNTNNFNTIQQKANQVLKLMADGADPNKGIIRSQIADLLSTGMGMYRDLPDAYDSATKGVAALGNLGAIAGPVGSVVGGAVADVGEAGISYLKQKENKITAEDVNRLAVNMLEYSQKVAQMKGQQLQNQSAALNKWGRDIGAFPQDYDISGYVTGGERELKLLPVPQMPKTQVPQTEQPTQGNIWEPQNAQRNPPRKRRPVNGANTNGSGLSSILPPILQLGESE